MADFRNSVLEEPTVYTRHIFTHIAATQSLFQLICCGLIYG